MTLVALYARVSTDDKDQDPETQLHALREHCKARNWTIYAEYVDHASATDLGHRNAWQQLLRDAALERFDTLLVWDVSRMSREVAHATNILQRLKSWDIRFVSLSEPEINNTDTDTGELVFNLKVSFAQFERQQISARVRAGMARARAQGKHVGRPPGAKDKAPRKRSGYFARWERERAKRKASKKQP